MKQEKVIIGYDRDYPGSYAWPNYKVRCPICKRMTSDYGDVSEIDGDGDEHFLCPKCVAKYCQD